MLLIQHKTADSPLRVIRLQQIKIGFPFVANHLSAGEATDGDDHGEVIDVDDDGKIKKQLLTLIGSRPRRTEGKGI